MQFRRATGRPPGSRWLGFALLTHPSTGHAFALQPRLNTFPSRASATLPSSASSPKSTHVFSTENATTTNQPFPKPNDFKFTLALDFKDAIAKFEAKIENFEFKIQRLEDTIATVPSNVLTNVPTTDIEAEIHDQKCALQLLENRCQTLEQALDQLVQHCATMSNSLATLTKSLSEVHQTQANLTNMVNMKMSSSMAPSTSLTTAVTTSATCTPCTSPTTSATPCAVQRRCSRNSLSSRASRTVKFEDEPDDLDAVSESSWTEELYAIVKEEAHNQGVFDDRRARGRKGEKWISSQFDRIRLEISSNPFVIEEAAAFL